MVNSGVNHQVAARANGCQQCKPVALAAPVLVLAAGRLPSPLRGAARCRVPGGPEEKLCLLAARRAGWVERSAVYCRGAVAGRVGVEGRGAVLEQNRDADA